MSQQLLQAFSQVHQTSLATDRWRAVLSGELSCQENCHVEGVAQLTSILGVGHVWTCVYLSLPRFAVFHFTNMLPTHVCRKVSIFL